MDNCQDIKRDFRIEGEYDHKPQVNAQFWFRGNYNAVDR